MIMRISEITESASAGASSAGSVATSPGAGNGFLYGGPGTLSRPGVVNATVIPKKKNRRKPKLVPVQ
jgi:hypothetical protein